MRRFTTNVPEKEAMDEHTGCPRKHSFECLLRYTVLDIKDF